jgi:hypothetical protein
MSRFLPKEPNLDHFKHEAKAILKSHREGDPSTCEVLRLLRRFDKASDESILASVVKLTEVQFALALDYGFGSWAKLRAITPKPVPADYSPEVQDDALLLPDVPVGGKGPDGETACLAMLLEYLGVAVDSVTVGGDLGKAFIFQSDALHKPFGADSPNLDIGWWPLDGWGCEHRLGFLSDAHGVSLTAYQYSLDEYRANPEAYFRQYAVQPITDCLQDGRPVVAIGHDLNLVIGIDSGNPPLLGQLCCMAERKVQRLGRYPWRWLIPDAPRNPMDRREIDRESLGYAVRIARDEEDISKFPGKSGGRKSWALWAEQLADETLAGHHYYSSNVVGHLIRHRRCAAQYLREMATRHPSEATEALLRAAAEYEEVLVVLRQMDTSADAWTEEGRKAVVTRIHQAVAHEVNAHAAMEQATAAM